MFDYGTLNSRRRLEAFLNSEPKEVKDNPKEEKIPKDSFLRKTINYFTEKSDQWYDSVNNTIEYNYPRTFFGDIKNIKNYLINLFSKD